MNHAKSVATPITIDAFHARWPGLTLIPAFDKPDDLFKYRLGGKVLIPSRTAWMGIHNEGGMRAGYVGILLHEYQHTLQDKRPLELLRMASAHYRTNQRGRPAYAAQLLALFMLDGRERAMELVAHASTRGVQSYGPFIRRRGLERRTRRYFERRMAQFTSGEYGDFAELAEWLRGYQPAYGA